VQEVLLFNKLFPVVDAYHLCEDTAQQSCAGGAQMANFWRFFASCISANLMAALPNIGGGVCSTPQFG